MESSLGVLDIPPEHRRRLDGKTVRIVLVNAEEEGADDGSETLFARLRRVRVQGPADLSANHDAYVGGERDVATADGALLLSASHSGM